MVKIILTIIFTLNFTHHIEQKINSSSWQGASWGQGHLNDTLPEERAAELKSMI